MTRRIEAGPVLVGLGALILLISLFLDWYQPAVTAWEAFEVLDLLLAALAIEALAAAAGAIRREATVVEPHWLPAIVAAITIIVVAQLLNPPPVLVEGDLDLGAWLALGAAIVMCLGTLLTLGRISFALTVEGRDTRRRVSAVDHRADDPVTSEGPAIKPSGDEQG
jgi:peptidoglycan/LPS O-acetylase OafA/YrhL